MILDIKQCLQAISVESPTGSDLREETAADALYYQIKDCRLSARQAERQSLQTGMESQAASDWQQVYQLGQHILSSQSKDLEVMAWLIEALLRQYQLPGLQLGWQLARQLIEQYWGQLYPRVDEEGAGICVAAFTGLNGEDREGALIAPIAAIPITASGDSGPVLLWQYQQALALESITDLAQREQRLAAGAMVLADIKQFVVESGVEFYQQLRTNLNACIEEFAALKLIFDEKCGLDSPPYSYIEQALAQFSEHLGFLLHDAPFVLVATDEQADMIEQVDDQPEVIMEALGQVMPSTAIEHRCEALKSLSHIADFFLKTEPHSPLPFLLQRAIRWGNLPLPELLAELISDDTSRNQLSLLTGIQFTTITGE